MDTQKEKRRNWFIRLTSFSTVWTFLVTGLFRLVDEKLSCICYGRNSWGG